MRVPARTIQVVGGLAGAGILAAGLALVAGTENSGGSVTFAAVGLLVLGVAVFSERIQSLEFGGAKMTLHALARERTAQALQTGLHGDPKQAARLRKQARALQRLSGAYSRTRSSMNVSHQRTAAMDEILRQAAALAKTAEFDPMEVWAWFDSGETEARVIALGVMEGDPNLRDLFCALEAIEHPRNLFEQYHALRVADLMFDGLDDTEKAWLRESIEAARKNPRAASDPPVNYLSQSLLDRLGNS
jgi:hypothetical protein